MTVTIDPQLEFALCRVASETGTSPEEIINEAVRLQLNKLGTVRIPPLLSHEEWVKKLHSIGIDTGNTATDRTYGREDMYD